MEEVVRNKMTIKYRKYLKKSIEADRVIIPQNDLISIAEKK